ncbi:hypothetical protein N8T08_006195 [Aspergillus melleus]|uniref:Uncharacterized protein n=1 Tax=Aspergillus melleus TaxID=138277 RepID=A0ACC3B0E4_9EURO|nr:hypothetical protein N8T08_006195 [Aspergillus melleus]
MQFWYLSYIALVATIASVEAKIASFNSALDCVGTLTPIQWSGCIANGEVQSITVPQADAYVQFFCYEYRLEDESCIETQTTLQSGCSDLNYERTKCTYWPRRLNATVYPQANFEGQPTVLPNIESPECNVLSNIGMTSVGSIIVPPAYKCSLFPDETCTGTPDVISSPGWHDLSTPPHIGNQTKSISCAK